IRSAALSDCGEYTCVIYNSEGETSNTVQLTKGESASKKKQEIGENTKKTSGKQGPPCKAPPVPKLDTKSRTLSWEVEANSANTNLRYIIEARKKTIGYQRMEAAH
ncbi:hypothetical protein, partial [Salmonella sp. s55962]|uniref:hypothetical protein n=1 Tax=Salmonella sp. s55962 TaxID=3159685 RepID=UPI0039812F22